MVDQLTFKRIGYVKVRVGNKILDRSDSIKVIRAFKYQLFKIGQEITINPNDKWHHYLYKNIVKL
ncbi:MULTISPECIES: hypothetical protein [unclassified Virgibacillus]|uniref:hypothetical protein n=1 Tax=unclassified Virgibacillus TaxID=2620237 RepID=UPI000EF4FF58|nr:MULTISPECIES: hypothetical protein [unclassified Virgibacillus]MDY7044065.1 hypothetical protein [Virgibacillus sp. M23]